jgi:hypothetical protein
VGGRAGDGGAAGDWIRRRGWLETAALRETGDGGVGGWRRWRRGRVETPALRETGDAPARVG